MRKLAITSGFLIFGGMLWSADYIADGPDPGRTGWLKDEKVFTKANVGNTKLLWKVKVESTPRQMHSLFSPLVVEKVTTSGGTKEIALMSGISDDIWAFDTATGKQLWHKQFENSLPPDPGGRGSTLCPGGQTAVPVIAPASAPGKYTLHAVSHDGKLHQLNVADGEDVAPPAKFMPGNGKPWSLNLVNGVIYTSTSQGCGGNPNGFFSFDLATQKASILMPNGGGMWGRRGVSAAADGTVYMGTGDGVYNPENKQLGNAIVSVKTNPATKQLELKGWFAPPNAVWMRARDLDVNLSPMVIDFKGRHFMIGSSKECRVWLVDRDVMNRDILPGPNHREMLDRTPLMCNPASRYDAAGVWGAMATWYDANNLYIAVPFLGPMSEAYHAPIEIGKPELGGVVVLRVDESGGKFKMNPVWSYGDIDQGDEAIYMNGILWVNGAGEDTYQSQPDSAFNEPARKPFVGANNQTGNRLGNSRRAKIFAFDATNGKLLWSSGDQIASWNHGSGMTAVNGKAYISTFDGYLYCFGVTP